MTFGASVSSALHLQTVAEAGSQDSITQSEAMLCQMQAVQLPNGTVCQMSAVQCWQVLTIDWPCRFFAAPITEEVTAECMEELQQYLNAYVPVLAGVRLVQGLVEKLAGLIFAEYRSFMLNQFIPAVEKLSEDPEPETLQKVDDWTSILCQHLHRYYRVFTVLETHPMLRKTAKVELYRRQFTAITQRAHPKPFLNHLRHLFHAWLIQDDADPDDCNRLRTLCMEIKAAKLLPVAWPVFLEVVRESLQAKLEECVAGSFEESVLAALHEWKETVVDEWMELVFCPNEDVNERQQLQVECKKMEGVMLDLFCDCRIGELFDIIVDFPVSSVALQELKLVLEGRPNKTQKLVQDLNTAMKRRLLQPGAKTSDIIDQYISTIKSLLLVDPTGVMLQIVAEPIREYLRNREDTVRCIIHKLFDAQSETLSEELRRTEPITFAEEHDEDYDNMDWEPMSREMGLEIRARRNCGDILNTLVNIYDTKDVFVKEFQIFLANRLLSRGTYDDDEEVGYVEMLKLRFGEASMQHCEVMLKDVGGSKRLNNLIQAEKENPIQALIVSNLFWPPMRSKTFRPPPDIAQHFEMYEKGFETAKRSRKLEWFRDMGQVELDLDMTNGQTLSVNVTPLQASIIWLFQERDLWKVEDLCHMLDLPVTDPMVTAGLLFWTNRGILISPASDVYRLAERTMDGSLEDDEDQDDGEASHGGTMSAVQSAQEQKAEQMQIYWSYINGMLQNLGSLPLTRIQMMLTMFVQDPKYDCTEEELEMFLSLKLREDHLELVAGGMYKLK